MSANLHNRISNLDPTNGEPLSNNPAAAKTFFYLQNKIMKK